MTTLSRVAAHAPTHVYTAMLVGIIAGSLSPILGRLAQDEGTPPLAMAAVRMGLSALLLLPFALRQNGAGGKSWQNLARRDWVLMFVAGALLAFYFTAWFYAIRYISVFIGMVLVTSTPIWIALIEAAAFRVRPNRMILGGMALALVGNVIIAITAWLNAGVVGSNPLLGIALALIAALAASFYRVVSRIQLREIPLMPYQTVVYASSTFVLLIACALTATSLIGYTPAAYTWMILLALLPQLIGYSASNYAVRFFSATYVTLVIQLEVVLSAIIALLLFAEVPTPGQLVGGLVIMAGVALASLGRS